MTENKINVLIVDDDENAQKTFTKILARKGYEAEGAGTGADAVAKVRGKFFNIAFIDIRLPDISGLDVLKSIGEINKDTVAIMLTAYASIDSSVEAINEGAYSYITKPVDFDQVILVIDKALEKQRLSMENRRLLRELKEANEKLKEMDQRKSYFVANVSHEFKNPLAIVKESMTVILEGLTGAINEKQKKILEAGKRNIERLIRLVTDLLDLSKIESGKMEMKREELDMVALAEEVVKTFESEISKKGLAVRTEIAPDTGLLWADKDKITEVIINLMTNAVKYTDKGSVTVRVSGTDQDVRFEVADTGPGISAENMGKLFDKFERLTAEKEEGTGLGLAIAKDIVTLHRGEIWVESEIGKGSKFIFTLPRSLRERERGQPMERKS